MNILLITDSPVINKLVTLSAEKTADDLDIVSNIEEIKSDIYDLVAIDDALYTKELFDRLKDKVTFKKSLYICARDAEAVDGFTKILKKPFLPTDLVELFVVLGRESQEIDLSEAIENKDKTEDQDALILDGSNDVKESEEMDNLNDFNLDDLNDLDDLDELDDDISLDDALDMSDETLLDDKEESLGESVLDDVEAQKVKDLLEETEMDSEGDVKTDLDDLKAIGEPKSLDLEEQIESAVDTLSDEELESELDEETLLDIASNKIDSFDGLSSRELKIAVGEEVEDEICEEDTSVGVEASDGVEQLKNLLTALNDKNIVASMKGMKISINIALGGNE